MIANIDEIDPGEKMSKPNDEVSEIIMGLTAVDPQDLEEFMRAMTEEVIPEIVRAIEERRQRIFLTTRGR